MYSLSLERCYTVIPISEIGRVGLKDGQPRIQGYLGFRSRDVSKARKKDKKTGHGDQSTVCEGQITWDL